MADYGITRLGKAIAEALFGIESSEAIAPKEAMTLPAMWFGVSKIAGHCGRLPLFIHQKNADGGATKAVDHWAYDLIKTSPNKYQTADVFREQLTAHAILWGDGRAAIVNAGRPDAELIPLLPDRTETMMIQGFKIHVTKPDKDDRLPLFKSIEEDPRNIVLLMDSEVLHIQGYGFDGVSGLSLVRQMNRTLGIPISQETFARNQAKKGFASKLLLEAPPNMFREEGAAKRFIDEFNEANSSEKNAGRAGLLREGMKANIMTMANSDAQFIEQRRFSRQDVMLMLGLDGMPGDGDNHSYNSKEMENLNYLDNAAGRWISRWESQIDAKILSERDRKNGLYSRFNLNALLRTDSQTQASIFSTLIASRVLSPNEAREKLDMNPYEGGNEYANPSITTGAAADKNPTTPPAKQSNTRQALLESVVRGLLKREANNAINGANNANFCGWIDQNYAKWESKLADRLEEVGLDRDLATAHCNESRELLLDVAGKSTPETLKNNVEKCVLSWENRVFSLIGEPANA